MLWLDYVYVLPDLSVRLETHPSGSGLWTAPKNAVWNSRHFQVRIFRRLQRSLLKWFTCILSANTNHIWLELFVQNTLIGIRTLYAISHAAQMTIVGIGRRKRSGHTIPVLSFAGSVTTPHLRSRTRAQALVYAPFNRVFFIANRLRREHQPPHRGGWRCLKEAHEPHLLRKRCASATLWSELEPAWPPGKIRFAKVILCGSESKFFLLLLIRLSIGLLVLRGRGLCAGFWEMGSRSKT